MVVASRVFLFILFASNGSATNCARPGPQYGPRFTADKAAYYGPAYPAGYGTFGLAAPALWLVLCLRYRAGQQQESQ